MRRPTYYHLPRRPLRRELPPLLILAGGALALAWAFPREALSFSAARPPAAAPACALVTLTDAEEAAALAAARASWQMDAAGRRRVRLEMFAQALPAADATPTRTLEERTRPAGPGAPRYRARPIPGSVAAGAAAPLAPETLEAAGTPAAGRRAPFTRRELLEAIDFVWR